MTNTKDEIKLWLEEALAKENLKDISVDILGNTEKGAGYMGDIVFVNATGIDTNTSQQKNLNLVLKCSKKSQALRDSIPVKEVFYKEILMYNTILPEFQQFQRSKSIQNVFDSFPKYYGHFTNETTEIIVLENLKQIGYELWDHHKPVTTKHLLMIMEKYGEFHAISAAMQVENPEKFKKFCEELTELFKNFAKSDSLVKMIDGVASEVQNLLKNNCDQTILEKFNGFKTQIPYIFSKMFIESENDFKIINHGDCWNNNFMWKHDEHDKTSPEKVAIIDWQISSLVNPISDLSYFIFSCASKEDLNNINIVLDTYYNSFSETLKQLGNNPEDVYSKQQFLKDWQKYARYGFGFSLLIHKLSYVQTENLPDIGKSADEGKNFNESFSFDVNDNEGYIGRIMPLIKFAANNKLID